MADELTFLLEDINDTSNKSNKLQNSNELTFLLANINNTSKKSNELQNSNVSLLTQVAKEIDQGALDYSWRAYLAAITLNIGFSYLNYKACLIFYEYAKEGAKYLPFYSTWNSISAGPMAFVVNFALDQFFMLYTLKEFYDLYTQYQLSTKIGFSPLKLTLKLAIKLLATLVVASFASYVFVALGEKLHSLEIKIDIGIVMLIMNWVGADQAWKFPAQVLDFCKNFWFLLTNLSTVKDELMHFWQKEISLNKKLPSQYSKQKQDTVSQFKTVMSQLREDTIKKEFSAESCAKSIKEKSNSIPTQPELTWKNSLSRQWLLYGALLVGQFSMAIPNYGLLRTTIDSLQNWQITNIVAKSILGSFATIPFIVLSINLANSGTGSMFAMLEWGWQKMLSLYQYRYDKQSTPLPTDIQTHATEKPKSTWKNGLQIGLSLLTFVGIIVGYYAAGQSSATGLQINEQYDLNDPWARVFNIFAHIIFNGEGIKEILLAILGLAISYLIANEKERTWTYNKDNLTGTALFSTRADNFEKYVENNAETMLAPA